MSEKSEFQVEVVQLGAIDPHPNADTLSVTSVNGYPCIIKSGTFKPGDRAVYVPVDALVPTASPEFDFLRKGDVERHRIKAVRLRGVFSMGLLVAAKDEWAVGQNVQAELKIEKWVSPEERGLMKNAASASAIAALRSKRVTWMPVYGLDAFRRHGHVFVEGEDVVITEKIHGSSARFAYRGGRLYVGSHRTMRGATQHRVVEWLNRRWLRIRRWFGFESRTHTFEAVGDVWWECARDYKLADILKGFPDLVLYGEIYGERVQDLTYDSPKGRRFRAFDVYDVKAGRFWDWDAVESLCRNLKIPHVPILYRGPWRKDFVAFAEGKSKLANHVREGVVIKSATERFDPRAGRTALKLVGEGYLLRKESPNEVA